MTAYWEQKKFGVTANSSNSKLADTSCFRYSICSVQYLESARHRIKASSKKALPKQSVAQKIKSERNLKCYQILIKKQKKNGICRHRSRCSWKCSTSKHWNIEPNNFKLLNWWRRTLKRLYANAITWKLSAPSLQEIQPRKKISCSGALGELCGRVGPSRRGLRWEVFKGGIMWVKRI